MNSLDTETGQVSESEVPSQISYVIDRFQSGNRLYLLYRNMKSSYGVLVFNLETLEYEKDIPVSSEITGDADQIASDGLDRLFISADEKIFCLDMSGSILSSIDTGKEVSNLSAYWPLRNVLIFEVIDNYRSWGYDHFMDCLAAVSMNGNSFDQLAAPLQDNNGSMYLLGQEYFVDRQNYTTLDGNTLYVDCPVSNTLDAVDLTSLDLTSGQVGSIRSVSRNNRKENGDLLKDMVDSRIVPRSTWRRLIASMSADSISELSSTQMKVTATYPAGGEIVSLGRAKDKIQVVTLTGSQYELESIDPPTYNLPLTEQRSLEQGQSLTLPLPSTDGWQYSPSWQSEHPEIASISSDGTVFGWKPGETTIVCDFGYDESILIPLTVTASATQNTPLESISLNGQPSNTLIRDYSSWGDLYGSVIPAVLAETDSGYERMEYMNDRLHVESYNDDHQLIRSFDLPLALPVFGGVFAGEHFNFVVTGQTNQNEDNSLDVIQVEKYDKNWNRVGQTGLSNINTVIPFDAGSLAMSEAAGKLYIHTCHEMYTSDDGRNHQANMTFVLSQDSLELLDSFTDVLNLAQAGYVSHSFNQLMDTDGTSIFRVDHGDAYPRGIAITKAAVDGRIDSVKAIVPFQIAGSIGLNYTGTTIGGMGLSSNTILVSGTCRDPNTSGKADTSNVFVIVADKNLSSSRTIWMTDYPEGIDTCNTRVVALDGKGFVLMWNEIDRSGKSVTKVCSLDVNGQLTSEIMPIDMPVSAVRPVLFGDGTIRWYSTDDSEPTLHILRPLQIDAIPTVRKAMYRLYNPNSGEHFYTAQVHERDYLASIGWHDEGIGWIAPHGSSQPVYRLYNPNEGDHHYTPNESERDFLIGAGWKYEGIGWYSSDESSQPLYRQYNPNARSGGSHNYTTDTNERDYLVSHGWNDEGIGWYGLW